MIYQVSAILILLIFYIFYFSKLIIQNKQSIKTNQMGKGNKPKNVLMIERLVSVATVTNCVVSVFSIFLVKEFFTKEIRILGIIVGIIAIIFFAMAVITMKTSWRVGIPEEKTSLVTNGIYKISRNPAFVGFDLLYISVCLIFFNIPLLLASIWASVMLHLQILQEERHMSNIFGKEYEKYMKHTGRYMGIKK
ncbi:MAG: isoprenylcysteine carboxylmethyltransferase family protein [Lachnospiraceae bacterium]|nr:isoprenylcysteine carboxylmethyltransferase family protein [Lachnospiraceae bacterium]